MAALSVSIIILAYGPEPWLEPCVTAVLDSDGVETEVILVDNGCTDGAVKQIAHLDRVTVLRPGRNLGFPAGCNLGAEYARGQVLAFVNSDAVVAGDALAHLARCALRPDVGIATASLRLADEPDRLNSAGNAIHFLGLSWSGAFGEEASLYVAERNVAGASGAAMALSRETWDLLGGLQERYFLYHEDVELSLRSWLRGLRVVFVPDAVVRHHYEFYRNRLKFYLIERNRLIMMLTVFERRTLLLLSPALVVLELAMVASAARRGWVADKAKGWAWLVRNRRWIGARRRSIQESRVVSDSALAPLLASRIAPGNFDLPRWLWPFDWSLSRYWSIVRKCLSPGLRDHPIVMANTHEARVFNEAAVARPSPVRSSALHPDDNVRQANAGE